MSTGETSLWTRWQNMRKKPRSERDPLVIMVFRHFFRTMIGSNYALKLRYLKLAKFLTNHGITAPLSQSTAMAARQWREQGTASSVFKPEDYVPDTEATEKVFQDIVPLLNPNSSILEIGCNAGRNLNYFYECGFHNLTGIEIGTEAVKLFADVFPDTYKSSKVILGDATEEIKNLESKSFDFVFAHSVLVNIGPRGNHIFREMCRVCKGYILTIENEGSWSLFPRDFEKMFRKNGFATVSYRLVEQKSEMPFPHPLTREHVFKSAILRLLVPVQKQ